MKKISLLHTAILMLVMLGTIEAELVRAGASEVRDAPGLDVLGRGYDIFGGYAEQGSLKPARIFDWGTERSESFVPGFKVPQHVIFENLSDKTQTSAEGSSLQEYSRELAGKVGLEGGSYFFKGSVEASFGLSRSGSAESYYFTYMDVTRKWRIQFTEVGRGYLSLLSQDFKRALESMDPIELFELYGSHVVVSAVLGGRADFSARAKRNQTFSASEFRLAVEAKYKTITGSAEVSYAGTEYLDQSSATTQLRVLGGNAEFAGNIQNPDQYNLWAEGIARMPVLVDFVDAHSLMPIWELTENERRRALLATAFDEWSNQPEHLLPEDAVVPTEISPVDSLNGWYTINQRINGRYIDAYEGRKGRYRLVTRPSQHDMSQIWLIFPLSQSGDNRYGLIHGANGRHVEAQLKDSYEAFTADRKEGSVQEWIFRLVDPEQGVYTIQHSPNDRFLDAHLKGNDYGVVTRDAQADDSQRWVIRACDENCLRSHGASIAVKARPKR